jgi:hypothetical protein
MIDLLGKASSKVLPDHPAKSFYLRAVEPLDVLPGAIGPRPENFGLLLAINASGISNEFIFETAEKPIVACGGNSERSGVIRAEIKARVAG